MTPGDGLELWWQLSVEYEPRIRSRQAGLMQQVLLRQLNIDDIASSLEKFERLVRTCAQLVGWKLETDVLTGVGCQGCKSHVWHSIFS